MLNDYEVNGAMVNDTGVISLSLLYSIIETANVSETKGACRGTVKIVTEVVTIAEEIPLFMIRIFKLVSETCNVTERMTKLMVLIKRIAETANLGEVVVRSRTMVRRVTESVQASESTVRVLALLRQITENVSVSEAVKRQRALKRIISNILNLSEATRQRVKLWTPVFWYVTTKMLISRQVETKQTLEVEKK